MAELIKKTDNLNQGREKLNEAIKDAETAKGTSAQADDKATEALAKSESTQTQLDTIVIEGDSSVEAAQARVDERGESHTTLKARIDDGFTDVKAQLSDIALIVTSPPAGLAPVLMDGTDETSKLQAILDWAGDNGGGVVRIPKGVLHHTINFIPN